MKTALIAGALLLAATALVAAPSASAQPPPVDLIPCGASLEYGYVYCHNPVGRGCVFVYFGDGTWYCSG